VNGNASGMMIEACADLLDQDHPEDCIRKETEEEMDYRIGTVREVFEACTSPGSVAEILYFFVAEYFCFKSNKHLIMSALVFMALDGVFGCPFAFLGDKLVITSIFDL